VPVKGTPGLIPANSGELAESGSHCPWPPGTADEPDRPRGLLGLLPEFLPGPAGPLLVGVSVYREPADTNAVLFQVGRHDWAAADTPDSRGPVPPYQAPAELADLIACGTAAGLLTYGTADGGGAADDVHALRVDPWLADELHQLFAAAGRSTEVAEAHRRAARYWQWRAAAWPQERSADIHDLLEARQHLVRAGDIAAASDLTGVICTQLRAWDELGRAAELIQETLAELPSPSATRAGWLHELGTIAQVRGEHADAASLYLQAAEMSAQVGDGDGAARGHDSLGVLAQTHGEYRTAERHYRAAAEAGRGSQASGEAHAALPPGPDRPRPDRPEPDPPEPDRPEPTRHASEPSRRHARPGRRQRRRQLRRPGTSTGLSVAVVVLAATAVAGAAADHRPHRPGPAGEAADQVAAGGTGVASLAARERGLAATWVAAQVSHTAAVSCDPTMCAALRAHGMPADDLIRLGPRAGSDLLSSDLVVATAAVRREFGVRLARKYAPLAVARFGTGGAGIQIRVTAPDGAAACRRALHADQLARVAASAQLVRNDQLSVTPAARRALIGGRVDARMLTTIAALSDMRPLRVIAFGDSGPGADPGTPLRSAEVAVSGPAGATGARRLAAFLRAQRRPYLAASISLGPSSAGHAVIRFEFSDPSPLGLLTGTG
jgi:tetratricopeptide (TPR) repeat protein